MKEKTNEELFREYNKTHNKEIREQIIIKNASLVRIIASRMYMQLGGIVPTEDLTSYGIIGLIEVIDRFDASLGIKFETYASTRIRGAMLDEIRKLDWVPRTIRSMEKSIQEFNNSYMEQHNGIEPTEEEIAEHLGVNVTKVYEHKGLMARSNMQSLDNLRDNKSEHDDSDIFDILAGDFKTPEESFLMNKEVPKLLTEALNKLTEREKQTLQLIYYDDLNLKEAAQVLEVSESRVSQLHSKALVKMRENLGSDKELMSVFCF